MEIASLEQIEKRIEEKLEEAVKRGLLTRLERELKGDCGPYWKKEARKSIEQAKKELESGLLTIDESGVVRNRIGRVAFDDMVEVLSYVTDKANADATRAARNEENRAFLNEYRMRDTTPRTEELNEMRAAFGEGATVVDILTGKRIVL